MVNPSKRTCSGIRAIRGTLAHGEHFWNMIVPREERYAIAADRKVHDLLIEALDEWEAKRRIREQMRVRP